MADTAEVMARIAWKPVVRSAACCRRVVSPRRMREESGFSLVELLVVILIIGVLAAVAVGALLAQKQKAYGASAKDLASNAETAAETIATDNGGSYGAVTPQTIHEYEPAIPTSPTSANEGAWLSTAEAIDGGAGYTVTTVAPATNGERYTITRNGEGEVSRTCTPQSTKFGCATGSW